MNLGEGEAAVDTCMGMEDGRKRIDTSARASSKKGGKKGNNENEGRKGTWSGCDYS